MIEGANVRELNEIENVLLPEGFQFSDQQKDVIFSEDNANIVAGPGSGKTTVLIAKIAFLLKQRKKSDINNKGICVITHTNVAVDEIKIQLKKIGIENFDYPNFIGTIHDFFNHFFTYKAYANLFPGISAMIYEQEVYKDKFAEVFNVNKPSGYTGYPPTRMISKTYLEFSKSGKIDILEEVPDFYKDELILTFSKLLSAGIFRHNDTLSLSMWYILEYGDLIKEAFENRFDWAFLDESQDTNIIQYDLLNKIFDNSGVIYQKYGDPYQALYSMFGESEDAWKPSQETNNSSYIELSQSTRFGESIAKVLRTTCIEEYKTLEGNNMINSYKPCLLLFENKDNAIREYLALVNNLCEKDVNFKESSKKVGVVGLLHGEVMSYYSDYKKSTDVKANTESIVKSFYELLIKALSYYIKNHSNLDDSQKALYAPNTIKNKLNKADGLSIKSKIAASIKEIYIKKGYLEAEVEKEVYNIFEQFMSNQGISFLNDNNLLDTIEHLKDRYRGEYDSYMRNNKVLVELKGERDIYQTQDLQFGTVHSVKGETHKATMLLESQVSRGSFQDPEIYYDCSEIFEYLVGNYPDYTSEEYNRRIVIQDALKTAYVALSRPTHLSVVAINKKNLEVDYRGKINTAIQAGWEVREID